MERISFEVAKVIKGWGYPQSDYGRFYFPSGSSGYGALDNEDFDMPLYVQVWDWLFDKMETIDGRKVLQVIERYSLGVHEINIVCGCLDGDSDIEFSGMSKDVVIIQAIDYLVLHDVKITLQ